MERDMLEAAALKGFGFDVNRSLPEPALARGRGFRCTSTTKIL